MDVDDRGFAYLGQDTVRKYDTRTGKLVGEIPRIPERVGGGPNQPASIAPRVPGRAAPRRPRGSCCRPMDRGTTRWRWRLRR